MVTRFFEIRHSAEVAYQTVFPSPTILSARELLSWLYHKKVWISTDDIVLVNLRDYQDGKASVIHMPDEARWLKANGKLNDNFRPNEGDDDDEDNNGNDNIEFEDAGVDRMSLALLRSYFFVIHQFVCLFGYLRMII
ncbi:hypothetical protein ACLB2K_070902 [Fragaria x ananassa]